ncbi:MAG: hypothetical protein EOM26_12030 [Alphaproteobacteria bacterium]|nr:hypothetical protein [Alphaproteobacteria bacterium]
MKFRLEHYHIAFAGMVIAAVALTDGTFNFFTGHVYSLSYNYYFLSLTEGRLGIPLEIAGLEAFYTDDGQAHLYYGILPALLRLPFWPLVDLRVVPVSSAIVFLLVVGGALFGHRTLLLIQRTDLTASEDISVHRHRMFLMGTTALWLVSPVTILAMNSSVYHEPIAAAFFLVMAFIHVVAKDVFLTGRLTPSGLLLLGLLAALAVHARPHVAIGLYLCVCLFSLLLFVARYSDAKANGRILPVRFVSGILPAVLPMLIMLISGLCYLLINFLRWGDPFMLPPMERYGEFLAGEGYSLRINTFLENGFFSFARILPNLVYHLAGGSALNAILSDFLNTGFVRKEGPGGYLLSIWLFWLVVSGLAVWGMRRHGSTLDWLQKCFLFSAGLSLGVIALYTAGFGTVTFRYKVELWYPLFFGFVVFLAMYDRVASASGPSFYRVWGIVLRYALIVSIYSMLIALVLYYTFMFFRGPITLPTPKLEALRAAFPL